MKITLRLIFPYSLGSRIANLSIHSANSIFASLALTRLSMQFPILSDPQHVEKIKKAPRGVRWILGFKIKIGSACRKHDILQPEFD